MFRTTLDVCGKRAIVPSASVFVLGWFEVIVVQYCCVLPIDVLNVVVLDLRRMRSSSRDQHESNVGRPGVGPASLSRSVVCPRDWECHICGLNVFKWESSCFRCGGEVWVASSSSAPAPSPSMNSGKGKAPISVSFVDLTLGADSSGSEDAVVRVAAVPRVESADEPQPSDQSGNTTGEHRANESSKKRKRDVPVVGVVSRRLCCHGVPEHCAACEATHLTGVLVVNGTRYENRNGVAFNRFVLV